MVIVKVSAKKFQQGYRKGEAELSHQTCRVLRQATVGNDCLCNTFISPGTQVTFGIVDGEECMPPADWPADIYNECRSLGRARKVRIFDGAHEESHLYHPTSLAAPGTLPFHGRMGRSQHSHWQFRRGPIPPLKLFTSNFRTACKRVEGRACATAVLSRL